MLKRSKGLQEKLFPGVARVIFLPMSVQSWRDERGLALDADFAFYFAGAGWA